MLDHIGIAASDFAASRAFYESALAPLGIGLMMEVTPEQSGGYHGLGLGRDGKPFFWVGSGGPKGAGMHVAFVADARAEVDAFHAAAIAAGGRDNGAPGSGPGITRTITARSCSIPTGSTSRRCVTPPNRSGER